MINFIKLFIISFSTISIFFITSCGQSTKNMTPEEIVTSDKNTCILKETPKWYTKYPDGTDKEGNVVKTYHSGFTERDTLEHAKRFAVYEAQKNLTESINARMNLRTKEFLAYDGSDLIANDLDEVVKRVVNDVSAGGYVVQETHLSTCDSTKFQGWVLLEYDVKNEEKILVEQINEEPDLAIELRRSEAFKELEEELN